MITETHMERQDERYLTACGLEPSGCIYFDIETTGLKAETSHLYLIGYAVKTASGDDKGKIDKKDKDRQKEKNRRTDPSAHIEEEGTWKIVQLFAEKTPDEETVLRRFADICGEYRTVIHFNGDRFDIPYLEKKYAEYGLPSPFGRMSTVDIYRRIRPYKAFLALERLNQKTVEKFLGIRRKDQYDGGQLIDVYRFYRDRLSPDPEGDLRKLMLHNYEDVLGMFSLTKLLSYSLAIEAGKKEECCPSVKLARRPMSLDGERTDELRISYRLPVPVPVLAQSEMDLWGVRLSEDVCEIDVPVREGTLAHYFQDYRNYYYLPEEDRAIHKSVAQFVDKDHRVKAKADNCYVKKQSRFLPIPKGEEDAEEAYPVFRETRKEKTGWIELTDKLLDTLLQDKDAAGKYLRLLLDSADAAKNKAGRRKAQKEV